MIFSHKGAMPQDNLDDEKQSQQAHQQAFLLERMEMQEVWVKVLISSWTATSFHTRRIDKARPKY